MTGDERLQALARIEQRRANTELRANAMIELLSRSTIRFLAYGGGMALLHSVCGVPRVA